MSKRGTRPAPPQTALGFRYSEAVTKVKEIRGNVMRQMAVTDISAQSITDMLLPPDVQAILRSAAPYCAPTSPYGSFNLLPYTSITVCFLKAGILTPRIDAIAKTRDLDRLHQLASVMRDVHAQYATVLHVLDWIHQQCTPGAARYYWPTVCGLVPGAFTGEMPRRHSEPREGIGPLLPLLRETASTITAGMMAPQTPDVPSADFHFSIGFSQYYFTPMTAPEINVAAEGAIYNFGAPSA